MAATPAKNGVVTDEGHCDTVLAADADPRGPDPTEPDPTSSQNPDRDALEALPIVQRRFYVIAEPFAKGGIGQISAALDRRLDRRVAIKELRRSSTYAHLRFAREIRLTAKLQHPNIVQLHEAGRWPDGEPFFAMKLVAGDSLEGVVDSCVTPQDHLRLIRHVTDVCDAMAHAHSRRIVHRDLKPGNVLVGPFGETVVIDWGLAKDLGSEDAELPPPSAVQTEVSDNASNTTEGVVLGTPAYMPPEQAAGRLVDERADVYALGAVMYHVLSGKAPYFEFHPKRVLERVLAVPPTPLRLVQPGLPNDLLAIVAKAMARNADERYPTAAEMAAELHRYQEGGLVAAHDYSLGELVRRFVARHQAAVVTAATALLLLVSLGVWSFRNIAEQRDAAQRSAVSEAEASKDAKRERDQAILDAARSALGDDPTQALAQLKRLNEPIPEAATIAADALERGVARRVLRGHSDRVEALAYSTDGRYLASAALDGTLRLDDHHAATTRVLAEHQGRVIALAFADADMLVSGGYDGKLVEWSAASDKPRRIFYAGSAIRALAVEGRTVATVSDDGVRVWNLDTGKNQLFAASGDRREFAFFLPEGKLVSGSHHGVMWVWDPASGSSVELAGHEGPINAAALSPERTVLVSVGDDGTLRRWDLARAGEPGAGTVIGRGTTALLEVRFLDADRVVTGAMDGEVRVWDLAEHDSQLVARHHERVSALTTWGERWIASASWDKRILLVDEGQGRRGAGRRILSGHGNVIAALAIKPDGTELASASWDRQVRLWPVTSSYRQIAAHDVGVKAVAFSPDGTQIASAGHDDLIRVWDAASAEQLFELRGHSDNIYRVIYSPDGKWIASSSDDRTARLWPSEGGEGRVLSGHQADVEELAFSRDSRLLASAGEDGAVGLWPVDGEGGLLLGHAKAVAAVAFSPDGKRLASASEDGSIIFWDPVTRKEARRIQARAAVTSLAFDDTGELLVFTSRDGSVLAMAPDDPEPHLVATVEGAERVLLTPDETSVVVAGYDGQIHICALLGEPACRLLGGHKERVHAMVFGPFATALVTGSEDGTVRVFDTDTAESRPLRAHSAPVFDVAVHGDTIVSASGDGTIALWKVSLPPEPSELAELLAAATDLTIASD